MNRRTPALLAVWLLLAGGLSGCLQPDRTVIAALFAHSEVEAADQASEGLLLARVKDTCDGCEVVSYYAGDDASVQQRQLATARKAGADVLVLEAVDPEVAESAVLKAGEIPVVALATYVAGADWFVGVDPTAIGTLLSAQVADIRPASEDRSPQVLVVNGPTTDPSSVALKVALGNHLAASGVTTVAVTDLALAETDAARDWVSEQLRRPRRIDAIVTSSHQLAAGAAEALDVANPKRRPVLVGVGTDLAVVRRIIAGTQDATVYSPVRTMIERAADLAVAAVTDTAAPGGSVEYEGVPSYLYDPEMMSVDNVTGTTIRDGLFTLDDLCSGDTDERCRNLGLH